MTAMHSQLVALDDSSLETVAGGRRHYFDFNFQQNVSVIKDNTIEANGNVTITVTQSNSK